MSEDNSFYLGDAFSTHSINIYEALTAGPWCLLVCFRTHQPADVFYYFYFQVSILIALVESDLSHSSKAPQFTPVLH